MRVVRVVVLGGYGFFGSRLAARLSMQPHVHLTIAGRSAARADALARTLQGQGAAGVASAVLDAQAPTLRDPLRALAPDVVIHTAGPFQGQDYRVARACIGAGCHYVDLADGREFVAGISVLDAEAKAAGVSVLSGASSVPALSSAVTDRLAQGLARVRHIDIGISPGNRTDRGLSTVRAILGYCGQPLPVTDGARSFGWSGTWRHAYAAPVGERLLSPCDVPDLALLPARYAGRPTVRFGAGLELRFLHRAMNAMAWITRRGVVRNWSVHATPLKAMSEWFRPWGSDAGAMHVCVTGEDGVGRSVTREWELVAADNDGPYVPTLAASALVQRLAEGRPWSSGATPCIGLLDVDEVLRQAQGLQISAGCAAPPSLFRVAMGGAYARLDRTVQDFHDLQGDTLLHGEVETQGPQRALGAVLALLLGTPRRHASGAIRFELESRRAGQTWTRHFPGRTMRSRLRGGAGEVIESLGPARLSFALAEDEGRLVMRLRGLRFFGMPCPRWLLPRIVASERGAGGRLYFDIEASLPWIGRVTGYRGHLDVSPGREKGASA